MKLPFFSPRKLDTYQSVEETTASMTTFNFELLQGVIKDQKEEILRLRARIQDLETREVVAKPEVKEFKLAPPSVPEKPKIRTLSELTNLLELRSREVKKENVS